MKTETNTAKDKFESVLTEFELLCDSEKARHMSAYMRNQFPFFGIQSQSRKAFYKPLIAQDRKARNVDWDFLDLCWDDQRREFQYLVVDYLAAMNKFLTYEDVARIERYVRSKQWWDSIDGLDRVVGNIAFSDNRIDDLMLRWSVDEDFWVRRIAIDHQLLRKEKTDTALLEKIIVNNFGSREFFINKAIGWSLRDYSKTNPQWVRDFIARHSHEMSPLSIREGGKYI